MGSYLGSNGLEQVVVIGAGPAGLACAACLKQASVSSVRVLDKAPRIASVWRNHYQRLHLHTARRFSSLPGLSIPAAAGRYPSRNAVIAYLEAYAEHHGIKPELAVRVERIKRRKGVWQIECPGQRISTQQVIVATGVNARPYMPSWPGLDSFAGSVAHSSAYSNGKPYAGQRVLVIGFGNSGGEIALDLAEHGAEVSLSVRGPVNVIPKEIFGIPNLALAIGTSKLPTRLADALGAPIIRRRFGDLPSLGLQVSEKGPLRQIREDHRIPLIDIGTIDLIRAGRAQVRPGVDHFYGSKVTFENGLTENFDAVIAATGFRPAVSSLIDQPGLYDQHGLPKVSGAQSVLSGLWFCGFHISPTGMLREIGIEAKQIARKLPRELKSS